MRECSELASVRTYKPFDIVYVADRGQISPVHIILSGCCSIVQYLNINVNLCKLDLFVLPVLCTGNLHKLHVSVQFSNLSRTQVQYENHHGHVVDLQSPKKMESDCDIIQQMCMSSVQNQRETTASIKDETMSDFRDTKASVAAAASADDTTAAIADINDCRSNSSRNSHSNILNANEAMIHRSHFVEIGEFRCGSIFGLGEHMDDRAIVAKHTQVQCLLIPHYWLFEKKQNAGNIWQRLVFIDLFPNPPEYVDKFAKKTTECVRIEMRVGDNTSNSARGAHKYQNTKRNSIKTKEDQKTNGTVNVLVCVSYWLLCWFFLVFWNLFAPRQRI